MKRIYIAGPITHGDRLANVREAIEVFHELRDMGYNPFCPHLSHFANEVKQREYEDWMEADFDWIDVCPAMYRMREVKGVPTPSSGADREVALAARLGRTLFDEADGGRLHAMRQAQKWITQQSRAGQATSFTDVRPVIRQFSVGMENRLRVKDPQRGRRGWVAMPAIELAAHLSESVGQLVRQLRHGGERVNEEAFDAANLAMMVADVAGDLGPAADG